VLSPITEPIIPRKQSAKRHWGSHPYFTKRAWNVVQAYIQHYSRLGDVVLDPFGGSGVTLIESLVLRRSGIHFDVSPLSNFLAYNIARSPMDLAQFTAAFHAVEHQCAPAIRALRTLSEDALQSLPIPGWYPTDPLPANADVATVDQLFTRRNLIALVLLRNAIESTSDPVLRDLLRFTFSSTLNKTNRTFSHPTARKASRGDSGIMRHYRYWVPKHPAELDVWDQFTQRFAHVWRAKEETNREIGSFWNPRTAQIFAHSALHLTDHLAPASVDYIFTDPPYGAHIAYLDLATMWTAWLQLPIPASLYQEEMIVGGSLHHSREHYAQQFQQSFQQMAVVLKPDHFLSIIFAHKDLRYWGYLMEAALQAGFTYVTAVAQSSYQTSWHKYDHPFSVLTGEIIVTFVKHSQPRGRSVDSPSAATIIAAIVRDLRAYLHACGGSAPQDQVMSHLIQWLLVPQWAPWMTTWVIDWPNVLAEHLTWHPLTHSWSLPSTIS
jgi:hypothetical protein